MNNTVEKPDMNPSDNSGSDFPRKGTQWKDVAHLYLNSDVAFYVFPPDTYSDGWLAKTLVEHPKLQYAIPIEFEKIADAEYKGYLPILRRLSSMTEEEAVEIAVIMYGQPDSRKWRLEDKKDFFNVYRKHCSESFTIDKASGDIDRYVRHADGEIELETTLQHHYVTRYLLSKGFDLFGLLESGQAIEKTGN